MSCCGETIKNFSDQEIKYLKLLSTKYPNINSACTEIINLQAILNLPKGTEHFVSDIHGEYESFSHVLRNASGVIKNQISFIFGKEMKDDEKKAFATLIYYPERKLELVKKTETDMASFYRINLERLIKLCKVISAKYTRSKVRKALPKEFAYIIEELLHEDGKGEEKQMYYKEIIESIIELNQADRFITAISYLIQRLAIDHLHILGDIYDRGPNAAKIVDTLMDYHNLDIQWGNHDIAWMGAAAGCDALICNVVRIQSRYANLDTVEDHYGINLIPLLMFAIDKYGDDPCKAFMPKLSPEDIVSEKEASVIAKMHKAISIMQFKAEGILIKRNPEYEMDERLLLHQLDLENGTVTVEGVKYELNDTNFPTIDPNNPYEFTKEEAEVMEKLRSSFLNSVKIQRHARFLFAKGSIYTVFNNNLLFHGCIPFDENGNFKEVTFNGKKCSGKEYFDLVERAAREGYFTKDDAEKKLKCLDSLWYLWCGPNSPLFGKKKMTTFERYFIDDKASHKEEKNTYYKLRDDEKTCRMILEEFGIDPDEGHIVNGHVPVKASSGETPIKANGKLFVIDGGFARAYQKVTGIAGYTLIYNSHGLVLVSHEPFSSREIAIKEEKDILSSTVALQYSEERIRVGNTDIGVKLRDEMKYLKDLLYAYRTGLLKEVN